MCNTIPPHPRTYFGYGLNTNSAKAAARARARSPVQKAEDREQQQTLESNMQMAVDEHASSVFIRRIQEGNRAHLLRIRDEILARSSSLLTSSPASSIHSSGGLSTRGGGRGNSIGSINNMRSRTPSPHSLLNETLPTHFSTDRNRSVTIGDGEEEEKKGGPRTHFSMCMPLSTSSTCSSVDESDEVAAGACSPLYLSFPISNLAFSPFFFFFFFFFFPNIFPY